MLVIYITQLVWMETFGCLEAETALKDVWKCAAEVSGALSVEIYGITWMLKLYVISWDFQKQVCCSVPHFHVAHVLISPQEENLARCGHKLHSRIIIHCPVLVAYILITPHACAGCKHQ